MNEQSWILVGVYEVETRNWVVRRRRPLKGRRASVEADWIWALEREEEYGDVIGFFHTHPEEAGTAPSQRDVRTLQAWCSAFGKPLLCLIAGGKNLEGYVFKNDRSQGTPVKTILQIRPGKYQVES